MSKWISVKDKLPDNDELLDKDMNCVLCAIKDGDEYWFTMAHYSEDIGWHEMRQKFIDEEEIEEISICFDKPKDNEDDAETYNYQFCGASVDIKFKKPHDFVPDNWFNDDVVAWMIPEYEEGKHETD